MNVSFVDAVLGRIVEAVVLRVAVSKPCERLDRHICYDHPSRLVVDGMIGNQVFGPAATPVDRLASSGDGLSRSHEIKPDIDLTQVTAHVVAANRAVPDDAPSRLLVLGEHWPRPCAYVVAPLALPSRRVVDAIDRAFLSVAPGCC